MAIGILFDPAAAFPTLTSMTISNRMHLKAPFALVWLCLLVLSLSVEAIDVTVDESFDAKGLFTRGGSLFSIANAVDASDRTLVGGQFDNINGHSSRNLARINADGSVDTSFSVDFDGQVNAIAVQNSGKIIVSGSFNNLNGQPVNRVLRLNDDGSLDETFGVTSSGSARAIAIDANDKILLTTGINGVSGRILRLNADGTVDDSFTILNISSDVFEIALQADNKIVIGGQFQFVDGDAQAFIARLEANGAHDKSFDTQLNGFVPAIAVQPDQKIIISGQFTEVDGDTSQPRIARLNSDSTLDAGASGFTPQIDSLAQSLIALPNGNIAMGGLFRTVNGEDRLSFAVVDSEGDLVNTDDGNTDNDFNIFALSQVLSLGVLSDGSIVASVTRANLNEEQQDLLFRFNSNGELDPSLFLRALIAGGTVDALAEDRRRRIYVAGDFEGIGGGAKVNFARLLPTGDLDSSFTGPDFGTLFPQIEALKMDRSNRLLVGGRFNRVNNQLISGIIRLKDNGELDDTFSVSANQVRDIAVDSNRRVILGGLAIDNLGISNDSHLVRFDNFGTRDVGFSTNINEFVTKVVQLSNGKLLIGGEFTEVDGQARSRLARLNSDGSLDNSFANPSLNQAPTSIVPLRDGGVLVTGPFTGAGGQLQNRIAVFNSDGTLNTDFKPVDDGVITSATAVSQPDGKVIIGGAFTELFGLPSSRLVRLNEDLTIDETFNIVPDENVSQLLLLSSGALLVAGEFETLNSLSRANLARIDTGLRLGDLCFVIQASNGAVIAPCL